MLLPGEVVTSESIQPQQQTLRVIQGANSAEKSLILTEIAADASGRERGEFLRSRRFRLSVLGF